MIRIGSAIGLVAAVILLGLPVSAQTGDLDFLRTRAEASDYEQTTGYDEAIGFLEVAAAQSRDVHLTRFGYSVEGRPLPLVIWGTDSTDPEDIRADGRLRVFVQANIHAGEVCGKDAMLAMIRDLAAGGYQAWADSVILMIAPIYNADGNERVSLFNRPRQNGPLGGMGQRPNAQDLDLNRDHMKLASPEARSLVALMNRFDPEILVDLHTTNGTRHGYHLTYSPPLNPNTPAPVDSLLRQSLLPHVTETIRQKHGWEFYYYGNLPWRGGEPGWYTFDHRPRFNNNYVGLRNRIAILSEAYSYATYRERVLSTRAFVEEIVDYAAGNVAQLRRVLAEAASEPVVGEAYALRATFARSAGHVKILMGGTEEVVNPYSGRTILSRTDEKRIMGMYEYGSFKATESTTAPVAYLLPPNLDGIARLLEAHGIKIEEATETGSREVQVFVIDSTQVASRPFQGVRERTLFGTYRRQTVEVVPGSFVVRVDQPLGRLAVYLLEPRSDDGIVTWGKLDEILAEATEYPIVRIPVP